MKTTLLAITGLAAMAACNESEPGVLGNLEFMPTQCGFRLGGCSFDAATGVGGTIEVTFVGLEGTPTVGVELFAEDEAKLGVVKMADQDGSNLRWEVTPKVAGELELVARDAEGRTVDTFLITAAAPAKLGLVKVVGQARGPTQEAGYDETWKVNANLPVSFEVAVRGADDARMMGRFAYTSAFAEDAPAPLELSGSNRAAGFLYIRAAAGTYDVTFDIDGMPDVDVSVHLVAEAPPP